MQKIKEMFSGRASKKEYILTQLKYFGPITLVIAMLFSYYLSSFVSLQVINLDTDLGSEISQIDNPENTTDSNSIIIKSFTNIFDSQNNYVKLLSITLLVLSSIWLLIGIVPLTAVTVKRFRDLGFSGYWAFTILIPYLGSLVSIYLALASGKKNQIVQK